MKKINVFIATIMSYLMIMMILPLGSLGVIANAAENEPQYLKYSDLYLRSVEQYGDKTLSTYSKNIEDGKVVTRISLFNKGEETVLKEFENPLEGFYHVNFQKSLNNKVMISVQPSYVAPILYYMEFDFDTNKLYEIEEENFKYEVEHVYTSDEAIRNDILKRVNKKLNTNYSFDDKYYSNIYGKEMPVVEMDATEIFIKQKHSAINLNVNIYKSDHDSIELNGLYSDNFEVINIKDGFYSFNYNINSKENTIDIFDKVSHENYLNQDFNVTRVKDGQVISEGIIKNLDYTGGFIFKDNKAYRNEYKGINEYELVNGVYNKITTYENASNLTKDSNGDLWFLETEGENITINKFENGSPKVKYEYKLPRPSEYSMTQLYVYDDSNIILSSEDRGTVFINKSSIVEPEEPVVPEIPEDPKDPEVPVVPEIPVTPAPNTPTDVVVKPTENGVGKVEVGTLAPNTSNIVTANVDSSAKEVEVKLNDVQAIKNGVGSVDVKLNNNINMNIPFSLIDKGLLDGAKSVSVKFSTKDGSDILKGIKALNKVFTFNLLVEKESGTTAIHNFASGVAEIKLTLSDEELAGLNKDKLSVFYYNEETKNFEALETKVEGNVITFKTPHFSSFVIGEKANGGNLISKVDGLPYTGAIISTTTILIFGGALVFIGAALMFKKKKQVC